MLLKKRQLEGRSEQPTVVVISSQKDFCNSWPFFKQPIQRWIINPSDKSNPCNTLFGYERKFSMKASWPETISQLNKAGLCRLVLLGGAKLIGSFLAADQIDEIQLTLTPKILGGPYTWVPTELQNLPKVFQESDAWHLKENVLLSNNELLLLYHRNSSSQKTNNDFQY